jgi:hypothetical protein
MNASAVLNAATYAVWIMENFTALSVSLKRNPIINE